MCDSRPISLLQGKLYLSNVMTIFLELSFMRTKFVGPIEKKISLQ
jgi:hypothetical protein